MEGTPTPQRQRDPASLISLNNASDLTALRSGIVTLLSSQIQPGRVFVALKDFGSQEFQFETEQSWLSPFLEHHPSLKEKLEHGDLVGITQNLLAPRLAGTAPTTVLLAPIVSQTSLNGIIGVVSLIEARQLSAEEVESVRYVAQLAAPIIVRLQELERLLDKSRELDALAGQLQAVQQNLDATQRENGELQATLRMRAHLQMNVAHELRTPLAAIRGYSRMILDGRAGDISNTQKDYLNVITNNVNKLIHLLNWVSHVNEQGALHLTLNTFDLAKLWSECAISHKHQLHTKFINLREEIPNEPFTLIGDRERLAYVMNILLSSAVRFAREKSEVVVQFSHGRERDITVKIFSDTGEGISAELLSHAFDPTVGNVTPAVASAEAGADLNLSGVRDVVSVHGGRVFLTSRAGEGSTFIITLPAVQKDGEGRPGNEQAVNSGRRRR